MQNGRVVAAYKMQPITLWWKKMMQNQQQKTLSKVKIQK